LYYEILVIIPLLLSTVRLAVR